jgi:hypothetical protein
MTPSAVLVLGGNVPTTFSGIPSLVIRMPGETGPVNGPCIAPQSLDECLLHLRHRFADHQSIASLGSLQIVADHPIEGTGQTAPHLAEDNSPHAIRAEWAPRIEAKLCELLDDLGNCPLDSWKGALHTILNGALIANSPSSRELMYAHAGEPAIIIGSGPSANDWLADIARIRKGARIFCADTILPGLLAHGIAPDYVCAIEREEAIEKVLEGHENCGATLIASPFITPKLAEKWAGKLLFWWSGDDIFRWLAPEIEPISSGRSAGTLALAAAAHAGCAQIYLVGHDLAYRNGASHAVSAHSLAHEASKMADEASGDVSPLRQRAYVAANHGGIVETNGLWNRIRGDLEGIIANHPTWKVYNVCKYGGARIAGAPVGDLPEMPMELPPPAQPQSSGVRNPLAIVDEIRAAAAGARIRLDLARNSLSAGIPADEIAQQIQISRLCGRDHASLFHYITRSVYNNLLLRIHLEGMRGLPLEKSQRNAVMLTITTLSALMDRILAELP